MLGLLIQQPNACFFFQVPLFRDEENYFSIFKRKKNILMVLSGGYFSHLAETIKPNCGRDLTTVIYHNKQHDLSLAGSSALPTGEFFGISCFDFLLFPKGNLSLFHNFPKLVLIVLFYCGLYLHHLL